MIWAASVDLFSSLGGVILCKVAVKWHLFPRRFCFHSKQWGQFQQIKLVEDKIGGRRDHSGGLGTV